MIKTAIHDDGAAAFLAGIPDPAAAPSTHVLEVRNTAEYAGYLDDRAGYSVIDEDHLAATVEAKLREVDAAGLDLDDLNVRRALDAAGYDEVDYLRSLTPEMRPPLKAGGRDRAAHPGHWADDTSVLAASYTHEVDP